MAIKTFYSPRFNIAVDNSGPLFTNYTSSLAYSYTDNLIFSNTEITNVYNKYYPYSPPIVYQEKIFNGPEHDDTFRPKIQTFTSQTLIGFVEHGLSIPYPRIKKTSDPSDKYITSYSLISSANKGLTAAELANSSIPDEVKTLDKGFIFDTQIYLDSDKKGACILEVFDKYQFYFIDGSVYCNILVPVKATSSSQVEYYSKILKLSQRTNENDNKVLYLKIDSCPEELKIETAFHTVEDIYTLYDESSVSIKTLDPSGEIYSGYNTISDNFIHYSDTILSNTNSNTLYDSTYTKTGVDVEISKQNAITFMPGLINTTSAEPDQSYSYLESNIVGVYDDTTKYLPNSIKPFDSNTYTFVNNFDMDVVLTNASIMPDNGYNYYIYSNPNIVPYASNVEYVTVIAAAFLEKTDEEHLENLYYENLDSLDITITSDRDYSNTDISTNIEVPDDFNRELYTSVTVPDSIDTDISITITTGWVISSDLLNISLNAVRESNAEFEIELFVSGGTSYQIELGEEFKTAWDKRKFLVFKNGTLMSKQTYFITIPSPFNNYAKKILYTTVPIIAGQDRIEIFYIENQENFANVPFNRDTHLSSYLYYAKSNKERIIKIPYPNSSYRRSKDAFMVFNDKGEHLDYRYDYTVSKDGKYIVLEDHAILQKMLTNYLVFTFSYVPNRSIDGLEEEPDSDDTISIADVTYKYSYSIQNMTNATGLVTFSPSFADYPNMMKENFMLFGNSVFIDQSRYEIVSNNKIQFISNEDKIVANSRRYTMCIPVKQTKPKILSTNQIRYQIVNIEATQDMQSIFEITLPPGAEDYYPFLVFRGSRLMDVEEEYEYDDLSQVIQIIDSSCFVKKGRSLTIVYLNKSYTDIEKEIKYVKAQFKVSSTGMTEIPKELYHNDKIQFNYSNSLLFINGVFLEPERYTIEPGNWIKFNDNMETAGYYPPYEDKTFTLVYMIAYQVSSDSADEFNTNYSQKEIDPSEDNDETRFDELYSRVERKR